MITISKQRMCSTKQRKQVHCPWRESHWNNCWCRFAVIDGLISVNGRFLSDMTENLEEQPSRFWHWCGSWQRRGCSWFEVIVAYGKDIPKLFAQVQEVVLEEISRLTSLKVKEINIRIADIVKQETIDQIEGWAPTKKIELHQRERKNEQMISLYTTPSRTSS